MNAYAERLIGSIRRECSDWILIIGRRHLHRVLTEYSIITTSADPTQVTAWHYAHRTTTPRCSDSPPRPVRSTGDNASEGCSTNTIPRHEGPGQRRYQRFRPGQARPGGLAFEA